MRVARSCLVCGKRTNGATRCPTHTITRTHQDPEYRANRQLALTRDNHRCTICGRGPADGARLEIDHVIPLNPGGTHDLANLVTLCLPHHREKTRLDR